MKHVITYSLVFVGAMALSGIGGFLLTPARTANSQQNAPSKPNTNTSTTIDPDEGGDIFIPREQTPVDYLIDGILTTKALDLNGEINVSTNGFDVSLKNVQGYVTLDSFTLNDIEAELTADVELFGSTLPVSIAFTDSTLYCTALDNNIKIETVDFKEIAGIVSGAGVASDSSAFAGVSLDSIMTDMESMSYNPLVDGGYEFSLNLLGFDIYLTCDEDYHLTTASIQGEIMGVGLDIDLSTTLHYSIDRRIANPESPANVYEPVSNFFPLVNELLSMKSLNLGGEVSVSASGYDVDIKNIHGYVTLETLNDIKLEMTADIVFRGQTTTVSASFIDNTIYCSLLGNNIKMETTDFADITDILNSYGITLEKPSFAQNVTPHSLIEDLKSIRIEHLVEGGYQVTANVLGFDLRLATDDSYRLSTINASGNIEGVSFAANLKTTLNSTMEKAIIVPENDSNSYQAFNSFFPFVRDIGRLANETQFGIELNGSVKKDGDVDATTINGNLQFDLNNKSGEGKLSIVQKNDKTFVTEDSEVYPTHNIEINVDNEDMKFKYNEGMYGKFTLKTLQDLLDVITEFIGSDNPVMLLLKDRIPSLSKDLSESTISKIANGQYELLFNDYVRKLYADDSMLDIVIAKELLEIDNDIEVIINLDSDKHISGIAIPSVTISGMTVEFSANFTSYNSSYEKLPAETEAKYFDFSEIKFLLAIGLNTAEISYFHLTGNLTMPMKAIGIDLSGFVGTIGLEIEIFNDMSDLSTRVIGKLTNIPSIPFVNQAFFSEEYKELDLVYDNEYVYMTRHDIRKTHVPIFAPAKEETHSTKVLATDLMNDLNIVKYILGFGLGMSDSIMSSLMSTFTQKTDRTSPLDFSKIFNDYVYNANAEVKDYNGNVRPYERNWYLDINVAELANNPDLKALQLDIYGGNVDGLDGEYLQYILVAFKVDTGSFNCSVNVSAELMDINPSITPDTFIAMASYRNLLAHAQAHAGDGPINFPY